MNIMNKAAQTALKKSIKHWEENVAAKHPREANPQADACALCTMFSDNLDEAGQWCTGCPVKARTRRDLCLNTPWLRAEAAWSSWDYSVECHKSDANQARVRAVWQTAARKELDFLRSLLPKPKMKPRTKSRSKSQTKR